jgi:hypothetical protein
MLISEIRENTTAKEIKMEDLLYSYMYCIKVKEYIFPNYSKAGKPSNIPLYTRKQIEQIYGEPAAAGNRSADHTALYADGLGG